MLIHAVARLATVVVAVLLVATSALADVRSPAGTAELGATLADDPAVRTLVGTTLVDALLEDARESAPGVAALLPLIRPLLDGAVQATLDSPAGRAALARALTDAIRQLTFAGPIVLDLRPAVLAAADTAPEPLDTLARSAVERGAVGVVVLGAVEPGTEPEVPSEAALARVAGLEGTTALLLVGLLLLVVIVVGVATAPRGRAAGLRGTGITLLLVGAPTTLLLRLAPDQVTDRLVAGATGASTVEAGTGGAAELLTAVLPTVADGVGTLVSGTTGLTLAMAVAGALLVAVGIALRARPSAAP